MIENNKLFFKTYDAFNRALQNNQIKDDAIVFIKDRHLIWTHGETFDGNSSIDRSEIQNLQNLIEQMRQTVGADIETITQKFVEINKFLDSIEDTQLNNIMQAVSSEANRATSAENDLQDQIDTLKEYNENSDKTKHSILTQEAYDRLSSYDPNTIYFITEQEIEYPTNTWVFGNSFPITFRDTWTFGKTFPVTLN